MASPMPTMANALMQPTQGPGRFGPAPAPAPVGNLRLPPANALVVPPAAAPPPMMPPQAPPVITPAFAPHHVPEEERISPRVPVPKVDFHPKHHQALHDMMGEAFDDPGAANAVRDIYSILRRSRPHLHPRHVLETARDAWHAQQHGFMTPQQAGAAVGPMAEMRHQAAGGKHPADEEGPDNE